jgi:DNA-binding NtrC family response regulator
MDAASAVLVVEDDADVRTSARLTLAPHIEVIEVLESPEGLEGVLKTRLFDAVLLDMNFAAGERAGRAGLDTLARIQAFDPTIAVVLMTAYGGVTLAVDALKKGAVDFVLKPWRNDALIAAVQAAMGIARTRREAETIRLDTLERSAVERALARHQGNISSAASALGISRAALYRRIAKHGL